MRNCQLMLRLIIDSQFPLAWCGLIQKGLIKAECLIRLFRSIMRCGRCESRPAQKYGAVCLAGFMELWMLLAILVIVLTVHPNY